MKTVSYESIKADQAWITVTQHLQRRNQLLADGIAYLQKHPTDHAMANRLAVIQYHLRATVRRLMDETAATRSPTQMKQLIKRQWLMIHQLNFLLRQIDDEVRKMGITSPVFRSWVNRKQNQFSYKAPSGLYLN
ncbi:hypothetical protein GCM10028803_39680 [Larkinella knui]|uniref:Transposase n=1 Tax=Larkinella knui TaxID=2025310 RepID=A0A3P1CEX3_9BACT|nr:hypothetical protein [Larkinella knui]RRB11808.1 hypothetical protein EHT87_25420 [Larkinella knui]